jgi:hypothetical protein
MYYLKISEEDADSIMYFCRKCGDNDTNIINNKESFCISKTHIKKTTEIYKNVINEFTKLDPTLPRIKNMKCPNDSCRASGETKEPTDNPEIIYIRYDNNNMKYIYLCSECDYTWKNT